MTVIRTLATVAVGAVFATSAFAQSAREIRGASPYVAIRKEPAPKLIVDPPLPEGLAQGIFWAQYRTENVHAGDPSRGAVQDHDLTARARALAQRPAGHDHAQR